MYYNYFYSTGQRSNVIILQIAKNVHSIYTFGSWGSDRWVDPWSQFTNGETSLGQDSTYYLTYICPYFKRGHDGTLDPQY